MYGIECRVFLMWAGIVRRLYSNCVLFVSFIIGSLHRFTRR
uniref:Uncharacterized protein n=1 Tax=Anguilla anguilla TaxID=7936 RepID=A0A0E9SCP7_ANGAN